MPTSLPVTRSELSLRPQQLRVAHAPDAYDARANDDAVRIEIAIAIEILAGDRDVSLVGTIALRISRP